MSVATMWIREAISTSVSVVATCNKFISELVNWVISNKHTTSDGSAQCLDHGARISLQAPLRVKGGARARGDHPCRRGVARVHGQGKSRGEPGTERGWGFRRGFGEGAFFFFYGDEKATKKKGKRSDIARVSPSSSKLSSDVSDRFRKKEKKTSPVERRGHASSVITHVSRKRVRGTERCRARDASRLSASPQSLSERRRREQTSDVSHSRDLGSSPHWMAIFFGSGSFFSGTFATSMVSVPLSNAARSLEKSVFSGMRNARC